MREEYRIKRKVTLGLIVALVVILAYPTKLFALTTSAGIGFIPGEIQVSLADGRLKVENLTGNTLNVTAKVTEVKRTPLSLKSNILIADEETLLSVESCSQNNSISNEVDGDKGS